MRRNSLAVLALAMLLAVGTALAAMPVTLRAHGTVKSINLATRTITVDTGKKVEHFKVRDDAAIAQKNPKRSLMMSELEVGEQVHLRYTMKGPENLVSRLEVMRALQASNNPLAKQYQRSPTRRTR